jgi:hypothetical protein
MCPLCLATIALATAGAATTGWTALIASKYLNKKDKGNL